MPRSQQPSGTPSGAALTWIFDHCLRYPASYEMPLRDMYTFNCNPMNTPLPQNRSPETAFSPRNSTSTNSSHSSNGSFDAAADFRSILSQQISNRSSQPCELPVSFLTSFILRRCFTAELENVDFPQALTALDYLKDLDSRWKKEMEAALTRLGIAREDAEDPKSSGFAEKVSRVNAKARTVTALYTQIYVGLRRWILINDMLLEPQNKVNHIAMLNTLYPPVTDKTCSPTPHLTYQHLKTQRDGFFRYINAVAVHGKQALDPMLSQGAPEGESTSWPALRECLLRYVENVNELIDESMLVNEPSYVSVDGTPYRGKSRKVDSGISFGSAADASLSEGEAEKPLPQFPLPKAEKAKAGSFLERIAREMRSLGPSARAKNLRKMKSTTALNSRPSSQHSSAESSFFEIDEQKRRRLIGEATSRKISQSKVSSFA
ncbi:uncharacterized protein N7469_004493 [Penicillium citrinum]|uniref:Uncharacterized protein n=2 Tax=Penicillium TaxID=5073 RepID=A0A9W9P4Q0_PENCI|nr:uncharacterized protein N7469_004493 [Penicillium citrinum]KAJ5235325.1 hypothetical protein N7469_004493 [Penicillium citrinum]KAJ5590952.1 hypothetical protein N7450_004924 [Penicillium hetheringtonii]